MPNENVLSRRGLFMKLGMLFNGVVAAALTAPILGFLRRPLREAAQTVTCAWVPLGHVSEFPEGETRLATFRNPNVIPPTARPWTQLAGSGHIVGDQFQVFASQLRAPGLPGPLVSAIRAVHVPLPRRSILPRRLARLGSAGAGVI